MAESKRSSAIMRIAEAYEDKPVIRALIQVAVAPIPLGIGSAIDSGMTKAIENIREERARSFFDQLSLGAVQLTQDLIQQEDFLHAYFATLKASLATRQSEKIRLFANLLLQSVTRGEIASERFEDYLSILDDLSLREMKLLLLLKSFEDANPFMPKQEGEDGELENDLQRANRYWSDFEKTAYDELGIEADELEAYLTRLNRSGLYKTLVGTYLDYTGGRGKTTSLFSRFAEWLVDIDATHVEQKVG